MRVQKLVCEYRDFLLGTDCQELRFSWILEGGMSQSAFRLQVALDEDFKTLIWDTGKVSCNESIQHSYKGEPIKSCTKYFSRVMVWDQDEKESQWSKTCKFETAFLSENEWRAQWISPDNNRDPKKEHVVPALRKEFQILDNVVEARVYATAQGLYRLYINGERVGDQYLTPYWTEYNARLQYQTYDVTKQLKSGANVIGAMLGDGWCVGELVWNDKRAIWAENVALLAQIHVTYADGSIKVIATDTTWKWSDSHILMSEIYHGETYDSAKEQIGWNTPAFDDSKWANVSIGVKQKGKLIAQEGLPVKEIEIIKPIQFIETPKGEKVIDFGQNMVGFVRFKLNAPAGTTVKVLHAEVLDSEGNFYTENLRSARQTITYTSNGKGEIVFEPTFTFQGFRFIQLIEWPGEIKLEDFEGVVLHSDMALTGSFECSEPLINQLQHNILWGQKGNFVDVPTDCPQRDERLGWTGDAQVFAGTACYNMDSSVFFTKWLHDVAASQMPNGSIPSVIPDCIKDGFGGATGWADAVVVIPWTVYKVYGDKRILIEMYDSMKAWIEHMRRMGDDWRNQFHFGDWVALDAKEGSYIGATDRRMLTYAFQIYSTGLMIKTARVLNNMGDVAEYNILRDQLIKEYRNEYVTPNGKIAVPTQTAHILALFLDLMEMPFIDRTAKDLEKLIRDKDTHLDTGFLGTPYINFALTKGNKIDVAYELLMRKDYPSWLYQVEKGATTIWEHWDGLKPDGTFWSKDMNSFNHYAYGSIGEWMYKTIAGINCDEDSAAYKKSVIYPRPGGGLTYAKGSIETMYGTLASEWIDNEQEFNLKVKIPVNTTSVIEIKGDKEKIVFNGVELMKSDVLYNFMGGRVLIHVQAGEYEIILKKVN